MLVFRTKRAILSAYILLYYITYSVFKFIVLQKRFCRGFREWLCWVRLIRIRRQRILENPDKSNSQFHIYIYMYIKLLVTRPWVNILEAKNARQTTPAWYFMCSIISPQSGSFIIIDISDTMYLGGLYNFLLISEQMDR